MATSEARKTANRLNAVKSTGPRTEAGKERSRRNSLKHGLTGEGIVLTNEDSIEVGRLYDDLEAELRPATGMGCVLARRAAMLAIRLERSFKQESATIAERVRHAESEYDDARHVEVERLWHWVTAEPWLNTRKLLQTPEGVDRMLLAWRNIRSDLIIPTRTAWEFIHLDKAENLTGRRVEDLPASRIRALSEAIWGDGKFLEAGEAEGMNHHERRDWAKQEMRKLIEAEMAKLEAHKQTLDLEKFARDRAEAGDRALFDPSKEAVLARKYEAANERGLYRALREFREVEAEAAAIREHEADQLAAEATREKEETCDEWASSLPEVETEEVEEDEGPETDAPGVESRPEIVEREGPEGSKTVAEPPRTLRPAIMPGG